LRPETQVTPFVALFAAPECQTHPRPHRQLRRLSGHKAHR